ncbi:MAG: hypothetical protein ACI4UY_04205 [Kiritimatiellia bacterium]
MGFAGNLVSVLVRALHDPGYLVYFFRNYHPIRTRFPRLDTYLIQRSLESRLKEVPPHNGYRSIHIILRTTDAVVNVNSSRDLEDIGIFTKHDVIRMGARSVFRAARRFVAKYGVEALRMTIVTDRLSAEGRRLYACFGEESGIVCQFVEADQGNAATFRRQIEVAQLDSSDTLVAIFEDDYKCDENMFCEVFDIFNATRGLLGFCPHFHPDVIRRYTAVRIYKIMGRFYQAIPKTCCTFFIGAADIAKYRRHFLRYEGWEDASINDVWQKGICLSPCARTLAEHLHRSDLSPVCDIETGFSNLL